MIKNKKGFTLVELLAVIVILSVIIVIAVPKIMGTVTNSKKASLETATLSIISGAEKLYLENQLLGIKQDIKCSDVAKMQSNVYGTCDIKFDNEGNATVILNGKKDGKFDNLACSGTKEGVTCKEGSISLLKGLQCEFDGVLVPGAEFVHNQYTYRYKQEYAIDTEGKYGWKDLNVDGWHVRLTDKNSNEPVNTPICSYINEKPIVSTSWMFVEADSSGNFVMSQTTQIDVSSWDTDNVTNMSGMFALAIKVTEIKGFDKLETGKVTNMAAMFGMNAATTLELTGFDTSNVTNMNSMFSGTNATTLDLSSFNTSKVTDMSYMFSETSVKSINLSSFDTSNVTNMGMMFHMCQATVLDLSSFDTSNVTSMGQMFDQSAATVGYARTQGDADKFNETDLKPDTLIFTVKSS